MSTFNNRWIKLHESLAEWEWFDHPYMLKLWIYLLIKANFSDVKWHGIVVPRGSLVTSIESLSSALKLTVKQVRLGLQKLESSGNVASKTTNKYRIISICNYDIYQCRDDEEGQAEGQTKGKQRANKGQQDKNIYLSPLIKENTSSKEEEKKKSPLTAPLEEKQEPELSAEDHEAEKLAFLRGIKKSDDNLLGFNLNPSEMGKKSGKETELRFADVVSIWNTTVTHLPKLVKLSEERKAKVRVRWEEWSSIGDPMEIYRQICDRAQQSNFLRGDNNRGWVANFDWLISNGKNWLKILEGNYDNQQPSAPKGEIKKNVNDVWQQIISQQQEASRSE